MKTTKTLLLLVLLCAAGMVNAQCMWYYPAYQGGGTFSFTAATDSAATTPVYNWTFDDGGTATGINVQHTFTTTGMHGWCLNFIGTCTQTICDSQYVNICDWPVSVTHTEGDTVVNFAIQGAQPGWTYSWDFPDGTPAISTSATPTIVFSGPGNHWGNLDITTPNGCNFNANASVNITVEHSTGNCSPWAYASPGSFGQVNFVAFADSSSPATTYQWDFGDGTGSSLQNPQHTYATSGIYTYCVDYSGPNCSGSICSTVEVNVCSAGTYISYSVVDSTTTLTLIGAPGGSTYLWSFPDGSITSSTSASPVVIFPGVGSYDVSVTVTTPGGCTLTNTQTVSITAGSCLGWAYVQSINGDFVAFNAISDSSSAPPTSFDWTFGDGSTGTGQSASHTYSTSGAYQYCVTINGSLCSNTFCDTVVVDVCQFSTSIYTAGAADSSITFNMTNANGSWTYQWSFPGGTPSTSTAANPTVIFPGYGSYTASVTVTTAAGCVKNATDSFTVTDPCQAHLSANQTLGGDYRFNAYTDTLGWLGTYNWDFGDGTTGTDAYTFHAYQTSGTYIYCVTYNNTAAGCAGTLCDTVVVDICDQHADLSVYIDGNTAYFNVYADSLAMWDYDWNFGAASPSTSTAPRPSITFPSAGTYPITVDYIAHNGCTGTLTYTIGFSAPAGQCDTAFVVNNTPGNYYTYFNPVDSGNGQNTITWMFGDNSSGPYAGPNTYHHYNVAGSYDACMTDRGPGCIAVNCQTIIIAGPQVTVAVGGTVTKNGTPQSACYAQVFLIKDSAGYLSAIDTFILNGDTGNCYGDYYFPNLPVGTYYTKAALMPADPGYTDYLPTYSVQELNWADATAVTVNIGSSYTNINLIPGNNPGGPGFVEGWVTQGAGLGIGGAVDESRAAGDPMPGIQINLLNNAGAPVGYTYSDATGHFSFSNLALGTYSVYAEAINKVPLELSFTLTQNNPSVNNIMITVNSNSAVGTGVEDLQAMYVEGLMPNPTSSKATLAIAVKQNTEAALAIHDLTGRVVQAKQLQLATGSNNLTIDLTAQPNGVYYLNLTGKNDNRVLKLVKTQ